MAKIIILIFILLESANVITLYLFPESTYANGIGVFHAWKKAVADPEMGRFARYMVNWVAGTKLIFLLLLVVILWTADARILRLVSAVMALAIASFFWRLFPLIRRMKQEKEITPANYDQILGVMIAVMVAAFAVAAVV